MVARLSQLLAATTLSKTSRNISRLCITSLANCLLGSPDVTLSFFLFQLWTILG